jgi:hypothetical protein
MAMSREPIREMKKLLRDGMNVQADNRQRQLARDAALALLARSVRMHHRRLAVQRLHDPVSFGAQVPGEHWAYCREAAAASRNTEVRAMFALSEESLRTNPTQQLGGARHG